MPTKASAFDPTTNIEATKFLLENLKISTSDSGQLLSTSDDTSAEEQICTTTNSIVNSSQQLESMQNLNINRLNHPYLREVHLAVYGSNLFKCSSAQFHKAAEDYALYGKLLTENEKDALAAGEKKERKSIDSDESEQQQELKTRIGFNADAAAWPMNSQHNAQSATSVPGSTTSTNKSIANPPFWLTGSTSKPSFTNPNFTNSKLKPITTSTNSVISSGVVTPIPNACNYFYYNNFLFPSKQVPVSQSAAATFLPYVPFPSAAAAAAAYHQLSAGIGASSTYQQQQSAVRPYLSGNSVQYPLTSSYYNSAYNSLFISQMAATQASINSLESLAARTSKDKSTAGEKGAIVSANNSSSGSAITGNDASNS